MYIFAFVHFHTFTTVFISLNNALYIQ